MAEKRLSDLYELHIHGNTYHSENYVTDTYVDTRFHDSIWQDAVISFYDPNTGLPSDPSFRDRYIASDSGNDGTKDYIYEGNQEVWVEIEPQRLFTLFVEDEDRNYTYYDGSGVVTENTYVHNDLASIQGDAEGYHLQETAYDNLKNQDQEVYTDSSPTFNDFSITNPASAYDLSHDNFADYLPEEHRQGENSIDQDIHNDNITSSSITQHEGDITHNNLASIYGDAEGYHLQETAYDNLKDQDQEVYSNSIPNFKQITIDNSPTETNELTRKDYVDGLFQEGMYWQASVIDFYDFSSDEPSASDGDRYISTSTTSTSAFIENNIYEYSADTDDGIEYEPEDGGTLLVESEERLYYYRKAEDEGIKLATFMYHNALNSIQGGTSDEYYHLTSNEHGYLSGQDQSLETTDSVTFDDISITNPNNIYDLSHDNFADFDSDEHIDGTVTGSQTIHLDRVKDTVDDEVYGRIRYQDSEPTPSNEMMWADSTDDVLYVYDDASSSWVSIGVRDHGSLAGLGDDDHEQYLLADGSRDLDGDLTVTGNITADKVYNAVYNDLVDFIEVAPNEKIRCGYVYFQDTDGIKLANKRCQKGIVGITSDTYGFALGYKKRKDQAPIGISGGVLAKVDKEYPIGTPLTNNKNGELTKMRWYERVMWPERMLATMGIKETNTVGHNKVKVNERYGVKIR